MRQRAQNSQRFAASFREAIDRCWIVPAQGRVVKLQVCCSAGPPSFSVAAKLTL